MKQKRIKMKQKRIISTSLILLVALSALLSFIVPIAAQDATVGIGDASAAADGSTTTTLLAYNITDLQNFDITITYDPTVVNVTDATIPAAFGTPIINLEHANEGWVRLGTINTGAGQSGDVLMATLTLKAVGSACDESLMEITINELLNSTEGNIPANIDDGLFLVTGTPVGTYICIEDAGAATGSSTTTTLAAHSITDLQNFDITITYDPTVVNVTDATIPAAFGTPIINLEHANEGWVRLGTINTGAGQSDDVLMATLTLEALGNTGATTRMRITINELLNSTEGAIPAAICNGTFTVIQPDITEPVITNMNPTGTITDTTPTISASYSDPESGINTSSVILILDGTDVTAAATVTLSGVTYTPTTALSYATHTVNLTVSNNVSLTATETWTFTVEAPSRPSGGRGGGAPKDSDGDGYSDIQEMLAGTDKDDPCDPNPECAACLAIKPAATPTPKPTPAVTPTPTIPPTVAPTTPTPTPTPEEPGFEAIFAIAGLLAVAYLVLRRKRK